MIGAHLFRQTRSRIVAATAVIVAILLYRKKYKTLLVLSASSVVFGVFCFFVPLVATLRIRRDFGVGAALVGATWFPPLYVLIAFIGTNL